MTKATRPPRARTTYIPALVRVVVRAGPIGCLGEVALEFPGPVGLEKDEGDDEGDEAAEGQDDIHSGIGPGRRAGGSDRMSGRSSAGVPRPGRPRKGRRR